MQAHTPCKHRNGDCKAPGIFHQTFPKLCPEVTLRGSLALPVSPPSMATLTLFTFLSCLYQTAAVVRDPALGHQCQWWVAGQAPWGHRRPGTHFRPGTPRLVPKLRVQDTAMCSACLSPSQQPEGLETVRSHLSGGELVNSLW